MKKAIFHDKGILKFRGVQLDLGRQMESLDYIRSFMDFAGCYGYNCLVLYLEGRIRTKSFPYKSKESSYSPDDIKNIVEYAGKKSMEVVPVVPMFGHADLFLDCPELAHLAELRGGITGRFSTYNHVFCPSLKETHEFLDHYITEVSALFPSEYFHAGFDEAWDIGYCDLCKKRLETETQSDIFTKHLLDCHAILSEKLKKKMIIWDDLFDIYPRALDQLPKDIIMCSWHYDKLVGRPAGHCGGPQTDKFAHYDKLGFSYLFAPAAFSIRNVESLSAYALNRRPLGGLLTIWELTRDFLFSDYPTIAYAGAAWSGNSANIPDAELQDNAVRETTGCGKKEQISLIKTILNSRDIMFLDKQQAYLRGPLSNEEYERKYFIDVAKASL
ncbi:MAG: family 20 glycosylhydrolase [Kiritimatiellae bacterium]|nr:family 20 glycosylhydrolase [Kiritimatiellia bacterium]